MNMFEQIAVSTAEYVAVLLISMLAGLMILGVFWAKSNVFR
ncbi:MAG TPA: hypothetical protein VMT26_02855 [Candidatus Bathyarchaeia archaeon]|jgi:hypothetical protein|nr:hypothetical protein [Candidatus Bathyarchaeia archaeon]